MTTTTGRKVRGDAKLEQLDAVQREMLRYWFEENCTYAEITGLVEQQFGITVGKSAVGVYWRRHIRPERQDDEAEIVAARTPLPAADFDAATLQHVRVMAWTTLVQPAPDVDEGLKLFGAVLKAERQALAAERNALARERLALAERRVVLQEEAARKRTRAAGKKTTEVAGELSEAARIQRDGGEPRNTRKDTKGAEGAEKMKDETGEIGKRGEMEGVEASAGMGGRDEGAEVAAKALSGEGRSEGAEGGKVDEREMGKVENGNELPRELKNEQPNLPRFPGYSGVGRAQAEAEVARESRELARISKQDGEPRNTRKDTRLLGCCALIDFRRLRRIAEARAFFVVRDRRDVKYYTAQSRPVDRATPLRSDQTIRFNGTDAARLWPEPMRRVSVYDRVHHRRLAFWTNIWDLPAATIAELYRQRWQIELFFRWIKENLCLRSFYGTSPNAIRVQIWSAISTCLACAIPAVVII